MGREVALCPKCGHEVNLHQPSYGHRAKDATYVGCMECGCMLSLLAKLKAWRGTVTDNERQR